jgi:tetratricopeptide (TPR) repeat protein
MASVQVSRRKITENVELHVELQRTCRPQLEISDFLGYIAVRSSEIAGGFVKPANSEMQNRITEGSLMNKSLVPFIALFACVILVTLIMLSSGTQKESSIDWDAEGNEPAMTLSPFSQRRLQSGQARREQSGRRTGNFLFDTTSALDGARFHLTQGDIIAAEDALRDILLFDPQDRSAMSLLGGLCLADGRFAEAEQIFGLLSDRYPDSIASHVQWARSLEKGGRFGDACDVLDRILIVYPDSPTLLYDYARMSAASGNSANAVETLRKVADLISVRLLPLLADPAFESLESEPGFRALRNELDSRTESVEARPASGTSPSERDESP